jgi:hypothetical protein
VRLNAKLSASTGDASPAPMRFFSYKDPEQNTWLLLKVRSDETPLYHPSAILFVGTYIKN